MSSGVVYWYLDTTGRRKDALTHRAIRADVQGVQVMHPRDAKAAGVDRLTPIDGSAAPSPSERPSTVEGRPRTAADGPREPPPSPGPSSEPSGPAERPSEAVGDDGRAYVDYDGPGPSSEPSGPVAHDDDCPGNTAEKTCRCGRTYVPLTDADCRMFGQAIDFGIARIVAARTRAPALPLDALASAEACRRLGMDAQEAKMVVEGWHGAFAAVLRKHGGPIGPYAPEIALVVATIGVIGMRVALAEAMRADAAGEPQSEGAAA